MVQPTPSPRVFIGSSTEGESLAAELERRLRSNGKCDPTHWRNLFALGRTTLDQLLGEVCLYDFGVFIVTSDVESKRNNNVQQTPSDNVIFEIGLFLGALGVDRTFIVKVADDVSLPPDLAGATWTSIRPSGALRALDPTIALAQIEKQIARLGVRHRDFVLCIPSGTEDDEEFNQELKCWLLQQLNDRGIRFKDRCPQSSRDTLKTLANFRDEIDKLSELTPSPRYLLLLWPTIEEKYGREDILTKLELMAKQGCRIGFINEFPDISPTELPNLWNSKVFIRANAEDATGHICEYVKTKLAPINYVLLVNAHQRYKTAQERKGLYEKKLEWLGDKLQSIDINSWDEADARIAVTQQLERFAGQRQYDVVIASNDRMALGAESAILQLTNRRPKHLSATYVVGYDGLASAKRRIEAPDGRLVATIAVTPRMYAAAAIEELLHFQHRTAPLEIPVPEACLIVKKQSVKRSTSRSRRKP